MCGNLLVLLCCHIDHGRLFHQEDRCYLVVLKDLSDRDHPVCRESLGDLDEKQISECFFLTNLLRKKLNVPVKPITPLPGHWQSRLGPHPLHSEPCTYPSLGSSAGPLGGWGYGLYCRFTRVSDALSLFWACDNEENFNQAIRIDELTVRVSIPVRIANSRTEPMKIGRNARAIARMRVPIE